MKNREPLLEAALVGVLVLWALIHFGTGFGPYWDSWVFYNRAIPWSGWFSSWWDGHSAPSLLQWREYFPDAHRHPPFMEWGGGLCHALFHRTLGELGSCGLFVEGVTALWCAASYFWLRLRFGRKGAVLGVLLFLGSPRFVVHAVRFGIDGLIGSIYGLSLLSLFLWRKGTWGKGVILAGLEVAFLTKIQGVYLIPLLLFWVVWSNITDESPSKNRLLKEITLALGVIIASLIAAFLLWPALWLGFPEGLKQYTSFITQHSNIPVAFFGTLYRDENPPPWHYPWVFSVLALPLWLVVPVVVRAVRNIVSLARTRSVDLGGEEALLWMAMLLPLAISSLPHVPKFDGVRLLLPAYGPWIVLAVFELMSWWSWTEAKVHDTLSVPVREALFATVAFLVLLPSIRIYPYNLCYYTPLIGGVPGAERLGFDLDYLGMSMHFLNPDLRRYAKPGDILLLNGGNAPVFKVDREGWTPIPEGLEIFKFEITPELADPHHSVFAYIGSRPSDYTPQVTRVLTEVPPLATVEYKGVRIFSLHKLDPAFVRSVLAQPNPPAPFPTGKGEINKK